MAYSVSTSLAVDNATPKVGQRVTVTLTINNSGGTVDFQLQSVQPYFVTPTKAAATMGFPQVGSSYAGDAVVAGPTTVAAGSSTTVLWQVVLHAKGAVTLSCGVSGLRADTGAETTLAPSTTTITAS